MAPATTHHLYPPFAAGVRTAPLVSISLAKLEANDEAESQAFYEASKNLGFFYLNMEGSDLGATLVSQAEQLHSVQKLFFKLPQEERDRYGKEKFDSFFGYRHGDVRAADGGWRDQSYNMRKDDFVGNCEPLPCPELVKENWGLLQGYVRSCRAAIDLMIKHLEEHIQLPPGTLANLHRISERSGDHARFNTKAVAPYSEASARGGEHTDFGTLTILFNWLGGLQIRLPDTEDWVFVKPVPGSAVVNLGDALVKFTAGLLRSNIHRVVPPLPPQDGLERHSLVYFSRPEDTVVLRRLKGGLIDAQPQADKQELELTSKEWIIRRSIGDLKGVYTHKGGLELRGQPAQLVEGRV